MEVVGILSEEQLRDIIERLVAAVSPDRVILFGSYARGAPHEESDLNLCVLVPEAGEWLYRAHELRKKVSVTEVALEPLVMTPAELESQRRAGNPLVEQVLAEGRVVYERQ
ncbi:MAG: nucleotidyltransferase domain-containing protein [Spirochaetales bacterium]|nr:nucleotidyltransferase domain-containing protein [Spirochaetales bacterium]